MKYFFLAEGWRVARVWDSAGIWDDLVQRRKPLLERINLGIVEQGEAFWLYRTEEAVVMVEVKRTEQSTNPAVQGIAQVLLKRLIDARETLERLSGAESVFNAGEHQPAIALSREQSTRTN
ncbi:hypothetical protein [Gloeobacter morelensis]|uniref:Uncharacterized protein n=1 Tax=Gloeobacter morelensis MG652769 TaxID=2781736 RepID=A0ABY3PH70_9CYAN|nr:hypothetical protein [Gloeobacter morelensis]UFP92990.1 hypothetical protein ISF26_14330 [Gloeobacter morelensis MG652769]